jgi:hypothetical protein
MSTTISGTPPRIAIKYTDSLTGSYPSISRTGDDSRRGVYSVYYNDNNTEIFTTTLHENSMSANPGESITPFNEGFRPEQSNEISFYNTGSSESETSLGFSSRLSSKTQIKFSLNVDTLSTMHAQSASIMYYNKNTKVFDLAGGSDAFTSAFSPYLKAGLGRDSKLFNAIGFPMMSGSSGLLSSSSPFHGQNPGDSGRFDEIYNYVQEGSVTLNSNFAATDSQLISLSEIINHPFLLEKAVIEMNISSSNGWFDDITRCSFSGSGFFSDLGGPGVTISLLNQIQDNKREIILSSTIIPMGDTGSFPYLGASAGASAVWTPAGFGSFATPGAIVPNTGIQKIQVMSNAANSNGFLLLGDYDLNSSFISEVKPFGRSLNSKEVSERSYFGKEYQTSNINIATNNRDFIRYDIDAFSTQVAKPVTAILQFEKQSYSPYLLFPKDNLILAISKHRPVITDLDRPGLDVTGSHEFGISTGVINITLYGSLIKEQKEFHDTLNQNLTSNSVYENVKASVVDQFDIEPTNKFIGSYISQFFTGSMLISGAYNTSSYYGNGYVDARRGVRSSLIGVSNTITDIFPTVDFETSIPGFNRNVQIFSDEERYFDTLLPRIDQISKIEGADIGYGTGSDNKNYYLLGNGNNINVTWLKSWNSLFLFEPRFSSVTRTVSPFSNTFSTKKLVDGTAFIKQSNDSGLLRPHSIGNGPGYIPGSDWRFVGVFISPNLELDAASNDKLSKNIYGIGDGQYGEPVFISKDKITGEYVFDSRIRGFKYGLLNSNKEMRKWHFRRDRFGQFRDMLEQARDSKMILQSNATTIPSPIKIRFVGANNSTTAGGETFSNNLSLAATSSLPYFDGEARSRGDLPDIDLVP